jgi:hypothetical protein
MKYIISEEQFKNLANQDNIDKILDKINVHGFDSLSWHEKESLNNPDDEYESPLPDDDNLRDFAAMLVNKGIVDSDLININEDGIELYNLKKKEFPYFLDNYINIVVSANLDGGQPLYTLTITGEDYEEDYDIKERKQVFRYIAKNWPKELNCNIIFEN